ncbi:MAG: glyceraldehyde 3-phosphate dehydrogenase NAD-binding domain-containing protein [Thermoleophilia bacterium]
MSNPRVLGINGLGRIGKLTLWYHLDRDEFDRIVINVGREVGTSLHSVAHYIDHDSTYGTLSRYLFGHSGKSSMQVIDEREGLLLAYGKEIRVLRQERDPARLPWRHHDVGIVVDTTGKFTDPTAPADQVGGSLRGHLEAGARLVVQSSPFKSRQKDAGMPDDAVMLIKGINHYLFDPARHVLVSGASCTTTALAHMLRPLLDRELTHHIVTAGMSTVHAATNSQPLLDAVPKAGAKDLRKSRAALDNIILTSTNAAKALEQVMPEIGRIGFMADSVRIPTSTVSLIILNVTFQTTITADGHPSIDRDVINSIYRDAAQGEARGLVNYSEEQNVSADLKGDDSAVVIEATETHTRTGFVDVMVPVGEAADSAADGEDPAPGGLSGPTPAQRTVRIPVTHVKIFGWYDNEMGSYTQRLGELTTHVAAGL